MTPDERQSAADNLIAWNAVYKHYTDQQLHYRGQCTCFAPVPFVCEHALTETIDDMPF